MEDSNESILPRYPNVICYESTKKIIEQMEKGICKINIGQSQGTGFFCKIPFPDMNNMLPVFITNNHIINQELLYKEDVKIKIDIKEETEIKEIELNNRIKYTNKEYDITIIEIKEKDNINYFLELDDIIINDIINNINKNKEYINETIYIIQYPENKLSVSYGILFDINEKYNFNHKCCTKGGSSGSPILNMNNKIIGIHKQGNNNKLYNRGTFLNYPLKEFIELNNRKNEELLKEFNNKYNLNIENNKIVELDLSLSNLGNEGLKDLCKIEFKELKKLWLCTKNISDINILEQAKFGKIEILNLRKNEISDINILEKVNFKKLEILSLSENKITDISILEKVKFDNLKELNLGDNNISDITTLGKVNFRELRELYLRNNNISDITVLEKVNFEKLENLSLDGNKISSIDILEKVNFKELKTLWLDNNNISDLKVLAKVRFENLEYLDLSGNKIVDINILENANFKKLKILCLNDNKISDIQVLENVIFEKFEYLNLNDNKIDKKNNKTIISKLKSSIKGLSI